MAEKVCCCVPKARTPRRVPPFDPLPLATPLFSLLVRQLISDFATLVERLH